MGRSRWPAARQATPRGRVRAGPRFDALAVSVTSPRGGGCCPEAPTSRTNDGQTITGLAAEDSDQALDRLRRAGLCHLGFRSMKLIFVVRGISIVMALNWATVLRAVTAAKPTASASANLIMPGNAHRDLRVGHGAERCRNEAEVTFPYRYLSRTSSAQILSRRSGHRLTRWTRFEVAVVPRSRGFSRPPGPVDCDPAQSRFPLLLIRRVPPAATRCRDRTRRQTGRPRPG